MLPAASRLTVITSAADVPITDSTPTGAMYTAVMPVGAAAACPTLARLIAEAVNAPTVTCTGRRRGMFHSIDVSPGGLRLVVRYRLCWSERLEILLCARGHR